MRRGSAVRCLLIASACAAALVWLAAALPARLVALVLGDPLTSFRQNNITYYAYTPRPPAASPAVTLVVMPGLGGDAWSYARSFVPYAEQHRWSVLAPDFVYDQGVGDVALLRSLQTVLAARTPSQGTVLLYGFSRGSQMAHRFALFYPSRVQGAALMSSGTYTLPDWSLDFPLGVRDLPRYGAANFDERALARVPFWIGVGENDTVAGDVPREWDRTIGSNRVARARAFNSALVRLGARSELHLFPGQAHEETAASRASALAFLLSTVPAQPAAGR